MTEDPATYDPMNAAMTATAPPTTRTVFGELQVDCWPCVLIKGEGKVSFDPEMHQVDQRRTAIDLCLIPLKGQYNIERKLIAESNEWVKIIMPSLKALNTDLRAINNHFVQAQLVPTGRTYEDRTSGEKKEYTTFKFIAVYPDADACQAAADQFFSSTRAPEAPYNPTNAGTTAANHPQAFNGGAKQPQMDRSKAATFLGPMWTACKKDPIRFAEMIKNNGVLAEHFDLSSPEVQALLSQAA